jgi:DNA processing protein
MPLHEVLALGEAELLAIGLVRRAARAAAALPAPRLAAQAVLDQLDRLGARAVMAGTPDYPRRVAKCLGRQAPPVLFLAGDAALLHGPTMAVVGSRSPSGVAVGAARSLAAAEAAAGVVVVSGGARGIDTVGHTAALGSGAAVVVPPTGLARFRWHGVHRAALRPGTWCVVGQFPPMSGWRTEQALMRNRTIVALSDAVVAFEPRDTGGTWHTCTQTLRARRPLFVVSASREGAKGRALRRLVRMGAAALDAAMMPDADGFAQLVADYAPPPRPDQLGLFQPLE